MDTAVKMSCFAARK